MQAGSVPYQVNRGFGRYFCGLRHTRIVSLCESHHRLTLIRANPFCRLQDPEGPLI